MIISTAFEIPGKKTKELLGVVRGNTVRSRHIGRDIMAAVKNIVGGEIKSYTELLTSSREEALQRMIEEAKKLKADAVINVRFTTSALMGNAVEMLAYGTAVKLAG